MSIILNKSEFIIRRYVIASERETEPKFTWVIGQSHKRLAGGYISGRDIKTLSAAIKTAQKAIVFPSPEEIEAQKKKEEEEYRKLKTEIQERMKKSSTLGGVVGPKFKKVKVKMTGDKLLQRLKPIIDDPNTEIVTQKEKLDIPIENDTLQ